MNQNFKSQQEKYFKVEIYNNYKTITHAATKFQHKLNTDVFQPPRTISLHNWMVKKKKPCWKLVTFVSALDQIICFKSRSITQATA